MRSFQQPINFTGVYVADDPSIYAQYKEKWSNLPPNETKWLQQTRDVAEVLAVDASKRDKEDKSPVVEVALLKHAGLLKVLGLKKDGDGEQEWSVRYKVIRHVAKGDGSIGMLLGYSLLWSTIGNVTGTAEQGDEWQKEIISNNYFVGGAVNPRNSDLKTTSEGEELAFNGSKIFNTAGVVSHSTVLEVFWMALKTTSSLSSRPDRRAFNLGTIGTMLAFD